MNEVKYLVDNNALNYLGPERRASAFFRDQCCVPEEVAREAGDRHADLLVPLVVPVSARILAELVTVMATVAVGDRGLVDLYGNKGSADPILVATAIVLNAPTEPTIFDDEWVIATNDRAVRDKAIEFGIKVATPADLAAVIDAAGNRRVDGSVGLEGS